ncbi:hypothetical protein BJ170DRAFT_490444 [Xylariales sp. AK1849]|nr:hypothetical protein BJ170DRAFT_490444 [Xylariales sp. AK1849]
MPQRNLDILSIRATRDWETLVAHSTQNQPRPEAQERIKLIRKLRRKIKEYHEALLLQSRMTQLQRPSNRVLGALRQMFVQDSIPKLEGKARHYLDDGRDLVALKSPCQVDFLSEYLKECWATENDSPEPGVPRVRTFDEGKILRWVNIITIILAAAFLIGPILALYYCKNAAAKLALIAIFAAGFAASVALITNARRQDVFVGTATYVAVLVVFVSAGSLSSS